MEIVSHSHGILPSDSLYREAEGSPLPEVIYGGASVLQEPPFCKELPCRNPSPLAAPAPTLRATAKIPAGEVRSYSWVAAEMGQPKAARAVGGVMARNPVPLLYPCHRVVDCEGRLHNYEYGIDVKARILELEGCNTYKR